MSALTMKGLVLAAASLVLLAGCERPPVETTQQGFRGTAMQHTVNPRLAAKEAAARPTPPDDVPSVPAEAPLASTVYQNVKVLGGLNVVEFNRHMNAITQWVSPEQGCNYCHVGGNFADDSLYTKVVARRMIQMTQALNSQWKVHTGATGVTCYTCHRGQPVPSQLWFKPLVPKGNMAPGSGMGNDFGQNKAEPSIASASLPYDPFSGYLEGEDPIKVYGAKPLPQGIGNGATIQHAERTYALMMHFSKSLGQNCTFCHNTQAFSHWVPKKVTAWHGIRMERDINNSYITPLTGSFPPNRLGPQGDIGKAYCATCHQGQNKPVGGKEMAKLYAGLVAAPLPPLPPPVTEQGRSVLYFGVGSHQLAADQGKGLEQLISALSSRPRSVVMVSGYHSAAGEKAANEELAKQRAFAVRDALLAAGIAPNRVRLDKPQEASANLVGEDPEARRVEVKLQ